MKARKINQKDFAAYTGINYGTLRDWICYGVMPDAGTAYVIAVALGVSVEYLVKGNDGTAMKEREQDALARKIAAGELLKIAEQIYLHAQVIR